MHVKFANSLRCIIFGIAGCMLAENPQIRNRKCMVIYRQNNKFLNGLIYTVAAYVARG